MKADAWLQWCEPESFERMMDADVWVRWSEPENLERVRRDLGDIRNKSGEEIGRILVQRWEDFEKRYWHMNTHR